MGGIGRPTIDAWRTSGAKKAADKGPVVITDQGRPAHVLLTFEDYQKLLGAGPSLGETLAQKEEGADFDFDPPRLKLILRPVDFD